MTISPKDYQLVLPKKWNFFSIKTLYSGEKTHARSLCFVLSPQELWFLTFSKSIAPKCNQSIDNFQDADDAENVEGGETSKAEGEGTGEVLPALSDEDSDVDRPRGSDDEGDR